MTKAYSFLLDDIAQLPIIFTQLLGARTQLPIRCFSFVKKGVFLLIELSIVY